MNRGLNCVVVAVSALIMTSTQVDAAVINLTEGSTSGYTMTDGNTYIVQNSISFSNSTAGGSGMSVADNATVVLYIPAGITLTATGANGSGRTGGGAGILVPETATLIITGEGTVNAAGGNAGDGGNGENGFVGYLQTKRYSSAEGRAKGSSGAGGLGGDGGGGAGPGIGGAGGYGGNGGNGGAARVVSSYARYVDFNGNGNAGVQGGLGEPGSTMGNCYVIGSTDVIVKSGNRGVAGEAGSVAEWVTKDEGFLVVYYAACGGGGGGGGGAGSMPSCAIGGGASSGGGGGGGGSGALSGVRNGGIGVMANANGGGGSGGISSTENGASGKEKGSSKGGYYASELHWYYGGDGGVGGAAGAEGGAGTLYVSLTATVNVDRTKLSATTHSAAQYTITFDVNGGQFSSEVESLMATLGCALPDCIPTPTRKGYLFDSWRTATGEEYYGASGAKIKSSYPIAGNVALYAQWQVDETYVDHTVTTPEEVPYSYFDNDYPTLLAEHGGDYEAAALATAANGHNQVWECFVAGISPTNAAEKFVATIEIGSDGSPMVKWSPDLNTNGIIRAYKVYGKETLDGGGEWQYPTNSLHRFFKVAVEMP